MEFNNADMPAMPLPNNVQRDLHESIAHGVIDPIGMGLTKREYYAGLAMQGLLSGGYCIDDARNRLVDVPSEAINLADALLADLEKQS